jgi:hypothetical protein
MHTIQPLVIIAALALIISASAVHIRRGVERTTVPASWLFAEPPPTHLTLYQLAGIEVPPEFMPAENLKPPANPGEPQYLAFCEGECQP